MSIKSKKHAVLEAVYRASLCAAVTFGLDTPAVGSERPVVILLTLYLDQLLSFYADVKGHTERFLFDTGGGETVISPEFARREGCTPWGRLTGFQMRGERLDLTRCENLSLSVSGVTLTAPTAGVFDITKDAPKDAPPLAGSAALDMFAGKVVTLDMSLSKQRVGKVWRVALAS